MILNWGGVCDPVKGPDTCGGADLNGDFVVDVLDLLEVVLGWSISGCP